MLFKKRRQSIINGVVAQHAVYPMFLNKLNKLKYFRDTEQKINFKFSTISHVTTIV